MYICVDIYVYIDVYIYIHETPPDNGSVSARWMMMGCRIGSASNSTTDVYTHTTCIYT